MDIKQNAIPYTTRKKHGPYPAGSKCFAQRVQDLVILTFEDGMAVELPGDRFYLEGLESPPPPPSPFAFMFQLQREMDELVVQVLEMREIARVGFVLSLNQEDFIGIRIPSPTGLVFLPRHYTRS